MYCCDISPADTNRAAACKKGAALWHRMLKTGGNDVRHGTSCSLLTDAEARSYGIAFNSGFGEYRCLWVPSSTAVALLCCAEMNLFTPQACHEALGLVVTDS